MVDYAQILDDEVRAFLERTEAFYPPNAIDLNIAEQRRLYDALCADFDAGRPQGVAVEDLRLGGVPCRIYETGDPQATVVYHHGGGFIVGGLDSHDSICAEICARTRMRVVAVDYRLSPEHPFPADFEDARAAFAAVEEIFTGPVVLAGDSAGGNLAAAVAQYTREKTDRVSGVLLIYPGLGGDMARGSYIAHADAPGLSTRDVVYYTDLRSGGRGALRDPRFAPLADHTFRDLPPTVIFTAECDPLASDGVAYERKLRDAGVHALCKEEAGLVHGYLRARHMSAKAGASFDRIIRSIVALATRQIVFAPGRKVHGSILGHR